MSEHFIHIYKHQATEYHNLITPEDVEDNLRPALERVTSFQGKRILDLGSGTGRFPLLVAAEAEQMVSLDLHGDMLRENKRQRDKIGGLWSLIQGDMRILPLTSQWADVVLTGWAIGHFTKWYADRWQTEIGRVLREMHRVVKPTGSIIIVETLSTGSLTPTPPHDGLAAYYAWLENEWGFSREEVKTDFQFANLEEAIKYTEFFFGSALANNVRQNNWVRLPSWTGVWRKTISE